MNAHSPSRRVPANQLSNGIPGRAIPGPCLLMAFDGNAKGSHECPLAITASAGDRIRPSKKTHPSRRCRGQKPDIPEESRNGRDARPQWTAPRYTRGMRDRDALPGEPWSAADDRNGCDRSAWPVWVGRVGEPQPKADYAHLTPSERISLCWEITKQAWALTGAPLDESAFRRDSESLSRRGG